jgi:hypothetical protein
MSQREQIDSFSIGSMAIWKALTLAGGIADEQTEPPCWWLVSPPIRWQAVQRYVRSNIAVSENCSEEKLQIKQTELPQNQEKNKNKDSNFRLKQNLSTIKKHFTRSFQNTSFTSNFTSAQNLFSPSSLFPITPQTRLPLFNASSLSSNTTLSPTRLTVASTPVPLPHPHPPSNHLGSPSEKPPNQANQANQIQPSNPLAAPAHRNLAWQGRDPCFSEESVETHFGGCLEERGCQLPTCVWWADGGLMVFVRIWGVIVSRLKGKGGSKNR